MAHSKVLSPSFKPETAGGHVGPCARYVMYVCTGRTRTFYFPQQFVATTRLVLVSLYCVLKHIVTGEFRQTELRSTCLFMSEGFWAIEQNQIVEYKNAINKDGRSRHFSRYSFLAKVPLDVRCPIRSSVVAYFPFISSWHSVSPPFS